MSSQPETRQGQLSSCHNSLGLNIILDISVAIKTSDSALLFSKDLLHSRGSPFERSELRVALVLFERRIIKLLLRGFGIKYCCWFKIIYDTIIFHITIFFAWRMECLNFPLPALLYAVYVFYRDKFFKNKYLNHIVEQRTSHWLYPNCSK